MIVGYGLIAIVTGVLSVYAFSLERGLPNIGGGAVLGCWSVIFLLATLRLLSQRLDDERLRERRARDRMGGPGSGGIY